MSVLLERIAVTHPQIVYPFVIADLAASQDDTALYRVATSGSAKIDAVHVTAPWGGCIVGIAAKLSADKTAGTLTFNASVNGTVTAFGATVADDEQTVYAVTGHGSYRFAAGDTLGVMYDSSAGLLPDGSADAVVDLYVVFDKIKL